MRKGIHLRGVHSQEGIVHRSELVSKVLKSQENLLWIRGEVHGEFLGSEAFGLFIGQELVDVGPRVDGNPHDPDPISYGFNEIDLNRLRPAIPFYDVPLYYHIIILWICHNTIYYLRGGSGLDSLGVHLSLMGSPFSFINNPLWLI